MAISNHRLLRLEDGKVSFRWRDYRHGNRNKVMTLEAAEFLRRFLLHILPEGLVRIRYFGLLANRHRAETLAVCRQLLATAEPATPEQSLPENWRQQYRQLTAVDLSLCPECEVGHLVTIQILPAPSYHRARAAPQGGSP